MPNDGIEEYNLHHKATKDGYVYVSVFKGMYDLPQSRIIAQKLPEERLGKRGTNKVNLLQVCGPTSGALSSSASWWAISD